MADPAGPITRRDPETRYYLRVTLIVLAGLIAAGALAWAPPGLAAWRWVPLAVVYLVGGYPIAVDGWRELRRHRRLSIDFLMGAAAAGAALIGNPFEGGVLIFLFSLSKTLELFAMARTRSAVARLMDLTPKLATLVDADGRETGRIPVEQLEPGQMILVRPGERIGADGVVRAGGSEVDQAAITGESVPVRKSPGDAVYAGTIAQGGSLVVDVTHRAGETMLAKIIRMVEEAQDQRAPAQHFIDRFAHPYTLAVVAATAIVGIVPPVFLGAAWGDALYRAMTLLVVASPCALVIATPSAILSGIANGARHGILFKGGAYLDLAGSIDTIAFDKTGTLTLGRPRLVDVVSQRDLPGYVASTDGPDDGAHACGARAIVRIAAAVERTAEHHLARAIVDAARQQGADIPPAEDFTAIPGEGVSARVEGRRTWVGNQKMARRMGAELGLLLPGWTAEQTAHARSVVYVGTDAAVLGAMAFGDTLKPNAAATVRHLKYEGIRWITILSGDHPDAVRAIAAEVGADEVRAGLLPDEKVDAVRALAERSRGVAMVGDGVNDAPAMATATLGIAMGAAGTDVAIETADVVLMSDDVEKVDYVIHLGKRARRVVRQNTLFSVGWMLMLIVVTLTVGMPLTLAVVAHEGSTLLVAVNGLRLLLGRPHPPTVPAPGWLSRARRFAPRLDASRRGRFTSSPGMRAAADSSRSG